MSCVLCGSSAKESTGGPCPGCGASLEEQALASLIWNHLKLPPQARILLVGPSAAELKMVQKESWLGDAKITAIDPVPSALLQSLKAPHRFLRMELNYLTFSDHCFDFVLCNHVLSFVRSDYQAMSQVHRCLKNDGIAVLNSHLSPEKSKRLNDGNELEKRDLAWQYGNDYFERLEAAGFFVLPLSLGRVLGDNLNNGELVFCFKFREAMEGFRAATKTA